MKQTIIALTGKGGVGKTSLSATIVRLLVEQYPDKRILAIDADPAIGLAYALQVPVENTIDQIRKDLIALIEKKESKSPTQLRGEVRYKIYDAISEQDGFSFLAIGRPETAGCYCKVNAYLKEVITLLADQFDYVVIDGEAGIEQVNRRVMEKVTHLLLVSDASKKGRQVITTIKQVADELVMYDEVGVILNRVPEAAIEAVKQTDLPLLAIIGQDEHMTLCDVYGDNVMGLDACSPLVEGTRQALYKMGILN